MNFKGAIAKLPSLLKSAKRFEHLAHRLAERADRYECAQSVKASGLSTTEYLGAAALCVIILIYRVFFYNSDNKPKVN
jgi:hypothetical protein